MTFLLAAPNSAGQLQKLFKFSTRKDGTGAKLPKSSHGTLASKAARDGATWLAANPAALSMDFDYNGHKFTLAKA